MTYAYVVVVSEYGEYEKVDSVWTDQDRAMHRAIQLKTEWFIGAHVEKVRLLPDAPLPPPPAHAFGCHRRTNDPTDLGDLLRATIDYMESVQS